MELYEVKPVQSMLLLLIHIYASEQTLMLIIYTNPSFVISEVITTCKVNQLPGLHMAETLCGIFPSKVTAGNGGCISMP